MFQSLYSRLALVLLGVFITVGVLLFWFIQHASETTKNVASQTLHKDFAVNIVKDLSITESQTLDLDKVKKAFQKIMIIGPTLELYIIDKNGNVIAYQAADEKIKRRDVDLQAINEFIRGTTEFPIFGVDPRSKNKRKIFSAAEVYLLGNKAVSKREGDQGVFIGYLYAIIGGETHDNIFTSLRSSETWKFSLIGIFSGLLFLLLVSLLLFYALTRPLRKLAKEIKTFEDSDFKIATANKNKNLGNNGEFNKLKKSFYQMEQRIVAQLESLNKQDMLRREFLAYLSHDLRTPLTGMKAYIEAIDLKDSMPLEERRDFLQKALINGDRLEGMINELFELSRLENNQVKIDKDEFAIGDLLSDISTSLENKAKSKNVNLSIDCEDFQTQVWGDIAKIERVIQNLVENAVRYSEEGSSIILQTSLMNKNQLLVKIKDSGSGIDAEHLPHIYEPYYRASNQKTLKHKGAGLGLAICQRLLALQDIELQVESEIGKGTTFYFNLAVVK